MTATIGRAPRGSVDRLARALTRLAVPPADVRRITSRIGPTTLFEIAALLGELVLEHPWRRRDLDALVAAAALVTSLPPDEVQTQLHRRALLDPRLLELSPALALETQMNMLHALAPVEEVSVWSRNGHSVRELFSLTPGDSSGRARRLARRALRGDATQRHQLGLLNALPILRWQRPCAAIVFRTTRRNRERALAAAAQTARALAPVLEREELLGRNATRERALVEGGERLLTRIGFDLHDGPIQDVAALAAEVRLFRDQVTGVVPETVSGHVIPRFDDIEARLVAVDRALRETVHSLESPTIGTRPLDELVRRESEFFAAQTDIPVALTLRGNFTSLTPSQRIALLRIVQESLTNVREHSGAGAVSISLVATRTDVSAEITDNGRGFDVEGTLVRAAQAGRLGLVGMSERVRLLGGGFDIRSSVGGPTTVSVTLPAWRPIIGESDVRYVDTRERALARDRRSTPA